MRQLQWATDHEEVDTKIIVLVKHIVDEHQIQHLILSIHLILTSLWFHVTSLNQAWSL